MKVRVSNQNREFPLSWDEIKTNHGFYEDTTGAIILTPRNLGASYVVIRNGRIDISGHTVREYNANRSGERYRKYVGDITFSND